MLKKILCFLGIHDLKYSHYSVYFKQAFGIPGTSMYFRYNYECRRCGKTVESRFNFLDLKEKRE